MTNETKKINNNGGNEMENKISKKENKTNKKKEVKKVEMNFTKEDIINAGVDCGNGYFKYAFSNHMVADKKGNPLTKKESFESTVEPIENGESTNGDMSEGSIVWINGVRCRINSGTKIGERKEAFSKQNKYTRFNFYYALLNICITARKDSELNMNTLNVAIGTTTDIYKDEEEREEYKEYMLGNIDYDNLGLTEPANGKITFKYYDERKQKYANLTVKIKEMIVEPEGVSAIKDLNVKETGFDIEKNAYILDIGTQTSHIIGYYKKNADYANLPNKKGGYIGLVESLIRPISCAMQEQIDYRQADIEFKRRDDEKYKEVIDKGVEKFIKKVLVPDLEKARVDLKRDQIVVTGGTAEAIKEDLNKYFKKNGYKQLMFVRDGLFANAKGLLTQLRRELEFKKQEEGIIKSKEKNNSVKDGE